MSSTDTLEQFVNMLVPSPYDRNLVATRKANVEAALKKAGIGVVSVFEAGSFSHGTAIKDKADIDLMVWVTYTEKRHLPSSALTRFKNALDVHLAGVVVSISSPTVRVNLASAPHFEVVPAFYDGERSGFKVYSIPGRRDEWVQSAPTAHNAYVNRQNDRLNKKVKPLVRLTKAWKYHVGAPVSSFYLEMRTAEYAGGESSVFFYIDAPRVLRTIVAKDVADMNDPQGIAGRIPACASDEKRRSTKSAMQSAIVNLDAAEVCRKKNDKSGYWSHMRAVFGPDFPYPTW